MRIKNIIIKDLSSTPPVTTTLIYIALALTLGFILPTVNQRWFPSWISPIDRSTIITFLSAVASGMITLSGIVFSLIFVVVQFGSGTYSPRIVRLYAHSRILRNALGIFTGTFLYSLMAMRTVGIEGETNGMVLWVAFFWLLASVMTLAFLVRSFTTLTITNILQLLREKGEHSIAQVYGSHPPDREAHGNTCKTDIATPAPVVQRVNYSGPPAYINSLDFSLLVSLAREHDAFIHIPYAIGDPVKTDGTLATVHSTGSNIPEEPLLNAIVLSEEHSFAHEPKYAIRLLVDTAIRALSPAINDPTTAVQALDQIEHLLQRLGHSRLDIGAVTDGSGTLRLRYETPSWGDYLILGISEIMQYGSSSLQVQSRLKAMFAYFNENLPPDRLPKVQRWEEVHRSLVSRSFDDESYRERAVIPDREGIGAVGTGYSAAGKHVD